MTRALHRRALLPLTIFAVCAAVAACGATPTARTAGPRGTVRFQCNEPDALLEVDENHVGPVGMFAAHGILVRPGPHRVVVHKPGFFNAYVLVDVTVNTVQTLNIVLKEIPE